ncbi:TauD/TfdA family dioxygenase [Streptomyces cyaneofuscatus]|uniref:TauD/TfdA family dioxygenase n=1 Tax=Streptomyces cyaneofuscatus TaxID=66883 RepID=UPI0038275E0E
MREPEPALRPGRPPEVRCPSGAGPDWLVGRREVLYGHLAAHGVLLLRGLDVRSVEEARAVSGALISVPYEEREGFAPRVGHGGGLYSSTVWPADQPMCMHNELSYARQPPRVLVLSCLRAPESGGATAVADARRVLDVLPRSLTDAFRRKGWLLERHYNGWVGLPWQDAFSTDDAAEVERYCAAQGIHPRWCGDGLHTRQRRPAVVVHPVTGELCWFNQIAFLNRWTMEPSVRDFLTLEFGADGLPYDTAFGDGEQVGEPTVATVNAAYDRVAVREAWRDGDVLLVDNVLTAHAVDPYTGPREVVVAMGDPLTPRAASPTPL